MVRSRITVESVPVKDLVDFELEFRGSASTQRLTPITRTRAVAQTGNPNAQKDDIGLLVARCDQLLVGHLSLLPAKLWSGSEGINIVWTNAFFVLPEFRNSTAVLQLIKKVTSLDRDVFITGFNEPSRRICCAMGFGELPRLKFLKLDLRSLDVPAAIRTRVERLANRIRHQSSRPSMAYAPMKNALLLCYRRLLSSLSRGYSWHHISEVTSGHTGNRSQQPCFERDCATINWMLHNPWIREAGESCKPTYYFSDCRTRFVYVAVEFRDRPGNIVGFSVFSISDRRGVRILKTLDHRAAGVETQTVFLQAAIRLAYQHSVDQLLLPIELHTLLAKTLRAGAWLTVKHRGYQWMPRQRKSTFQELIGEDRDVRLTYQDGDCGFG